MFTVSVRDHVMIAHSFRGQVFGPAQRLHGATYVVDVEFRAADIDDDGIVIDIGWATEALGKALGPLRYQNLDELPEFEGVNTTTEYLARDVFRRLQAQLDDARTQGAIARVPESMKVTLHESHAAWAAYEGSLG
ncbi:6-pyruvoyl trahydropterin synthase family protein [Haliangium sp.]|uniref:6-pyruvoyl trahydropterin synthase family protein n=1 Tax=Haliangium sp. TaxID=2663208 RepID=UPI003D0F4C87